MYLYVVNKKNRPERAGLANYGGKNKALAAKLVKRLKTEADLNQFSLILTELIV